MTDEPHYCDCCLQADERVQHVDIAWPTGRHVELWLHPDCEQAMLKELESNK
jgi:hypothetical protein